MHGRRERGHNPVMSLRSYVQTHLTGSEGGSRLFERAARDQTVSATRAELAGMAEEVVEEREWMRSTLGALGGSERSVLHLAAIVGERLGRLVPNGSLTERTAMTDLTELEALRTAVSGKLAGFEALLQVAEHHPALDRDAILRFRDRSVSQLERLAPLHHEAAARALR